LDPGDSTLLVVDLDYSADAGSSWAVIDSNQANDGAYLWDVSVLSDGNDYLVRATATDTSGLTDFDISDAVFMVDNVPDAPQVTVTYPNGGEILADSTVITWTATDLDPGETALLLVDLDLSANAGTTWSVIDSNQVNDGAYSWYFSGLNDGSNHLVRLTAIDTSGLFDSDSSDTVFAIDNPSGTPAAITDLMASLQDSSIELNWSAVTADTSGEPTTVEYYIIYRSASWDFSPAPTDSIGGTVNTFFADSAAAVKNTGVHHYYLLKAVDSKGRKSAESNRIGEYDVPTINHFR
jgi:hypothetical protein